MAESKATDEQTRSDPPTAEYPEVSDRVEEERRPLWPDRDEKQAPPRDDNPSRGAPRFLRGVFWLVATVGLVMALILGAQSVGWLPDFKNPFGTQKEDRSQPPLLQSIQDLSRYVAAEGNFQVIIDVQENRKYIPDFLVNERILFVAAGTVDAYVDFRQHRAGRDQGVRRQANGRGDLPAPQLGKPNLDPENTRVYSEQRGLLNRLKDVFANDPNRVTEVYALAEERIAEAAKSSGLGTRAEENTRKMLEGLLRSLGYTTITVKYQAA
jgi:hypothetical protein